MLSYQIVKIEQSGFLFDSARRVSALTPFDQIREMCPIAQRDTHLIGELIERPFITMGVRRYRKHAESRQCGIDLDHNRIG